MPRWQPQGTRFGELLSLVPLRYGHQHDVCRAQGKGVSGRVGIAGVASQAATDARTGAKQLCHEGLTRLGLMSVSGRLWRLRPQPSLMLRQPFTGHALGLGNQYILADSARIAHL